MDEELRQRIAECQPEPDPLPNRILRFVIKSIFYAATGDALLVNRNKVDKKPSEYTKNERA